MTFYCVYFGKGLLCSGVNNGFSISVKEKFPVWILACTSVEFVKEILDLKVMVFWISTDYEILFKFVCA